MRERLISMRRRYKRLLQIAVDLLLIWLALWLAFVIRLGPGNLINPFDGYLWLFLLAPAVSIPIFIRIGMYRAVLRYMGNDALMTIFKAVTWSALLVALAVYWYRDAPALIPRSTVVNYWWLSLFLVGGLRLLMRQYLLGEGVSFKPLLMKSPHHQDVTRVAVYGAGSAGNQLVAALRSGKELLPVAFIDDDPNIANRVIAGIKVYPSSRLSEVIDEADIQEILLAMPSISRKRRGEVLDMLEEYSLTVRSVPAFIDLATGKVKVDDLQDVEISDLLGRDAVPPIPGLMAQCVAGKVVMVTGAGGSIGSELCRQILTEKPKTLLLFEHSEFSLYQIHEELQGVIAAESLPVSLVPVLGTIRNESRLFEIMSTWGVRTIYHAAAYKHVPLVEHNIAEGIFNNVFGTVYAAQAAIRAGVESFVLISTDKAVRPTNVMGSTKRLAEMVLQALSCEPSPELLGELKGFARLNRTRFTMVRFGNVLDSSGSVIPIFRQQIRQGGPVTVTHPNITRYFMTIPEAAQLVLQAGSMGQGGDVFVLDMGEPVKILDLAEKMVHLSGLTVRDENEPDGDIDIEFTGLRPGEKLFEELLIGSDVYETEHPMILSSRENFVPWPELCERLEGLRAGIADEDFQRVRQIMRELVEGYQPDGEIVDWVHLQRQQRT